MNVTGSALKAAAPHIRASVEASNVMPPLAALPTAASAARAHVRSSVAGWEMGHLTDAAVAVVSELVANAVNASADEHGRPVYRGGRILTVWARLNAYGPKLLVEVWDQAPGVPTLTSADDTTESGRGLTLVRDFSDTWGWYPLKRQPGKCVWAEISGTSFSCPGCEESRCRCPFAVSGDNGHVRKVPQLLTISTSPSASMRRSAATTVARDTRYSAANCATEGSRSSGCHSPPLIRSRSAASTRRLGSSRVRSDGI